MENLNPSNEKLIVDEKVYFSECKAAAEKGNVQAMKALANCYSKGQGTEKDPEQFFYWCKKAADNNDHTAMCSVSECYKKGYGVEKDQQQADYWESLAEKTLLKAIFGEA